MLNAGEAETLRLQPFLLHILRLPGFAVPRDLPGASSQHDPGGQEQAEQHQREDHPILERKLVCQGAQCLRQIGFGRLVRCPGSSNAAGQAYWALM